MDIVILITIIFLLFSLFILYKQYKNSDNYTFGVIIHKTKTSYIVQSKVNNSLIKCYSTKDHNIGEEVTLFKVNFKWYIMTI